MTVVARANIGYIVPHLRCGHLLAIVLRHVIHFDSHRPRRQFYSAPVLMVRVPARTARSFISAKKTGTRIST